MNLRARYRRLPGLWAMLLLAASASSAAQPPPAPADPYADPAPAPARSAPAWQRLELGAKGHRYAFPVYASQRLNAPGALRKVQRLVIVLHDERREAERSLEAITALYAGQAEHDADTLVIAPRFPGLVDAGFGSMPAWRRTGWMEGQPSAAAQGRPAPVGAFQVIDDLLRELTAPGRLPALHAIVVAGHGAGAQMAQRYAVLNPLDESLRATGLALSYVVANAESYLYLSPERPNRNGRGYTRYERGICPTYDQYRYGLESMPAALDAYQGKLDHARLAARYAQRRVVYLMGGADNNPEYPGLDKGCGAEAQGATPLARGLGYWGYEIRTPPHGAPAARAGGAARPSHQGFIAMGAGHSETDLYASACGAQALLGDGDWAVGAACKALPTGEPPARPNGKARQ
ncbi:MAG TPA: hypothetical protein VGC69_00295 [Bordetella sp.]